MADLSAVGEQYVDLRPQADQGPYLTDGSVIPERDTQLPLPVTTVLESINQLATSVPLRALRQVTNDLGTAFGGQGGNLQQLIDGSYSLVKASAQNLPQQVGLINAARTVLRTQVSETQALDSFGASARQLAATLAASNADIRKLIVQGPRAATQVAGLLTDNNPGLAVMIANLLTTSELTATRGSALAELLSALPADIAAGLHRDHLRRGQLRHRADLLQPAALHRRVRRHHLPQRPGHHARAAQHLGPLRRARQPGRCPRLGPRAVRRRGPDPGPARPEPAPGPVPMIAIAVSAEAVMADFREQGSRRLLAASIAVFVVALACAAWFGWSWHSAPSAATPGGPAQQRDTALAEGEQAVQNFNTLDYRHVDQGIRLWLQSSAGALHSQVQHSRTSFAQQVQQAKTVTTARVLDGALTALNAHAGTASIIVAAPDHRDAAQRHPGDQAQPLAGPAHPHRRRLAADRDRPGAGERHRLRRLTAPSRRPAQTSQPGPAPPRGGTPMARQPTPASPAAEAPATEATEPAVSVPEVPEVSVPEVSAPEAPAAGAPAPPAAENSAAENSVTEAPATPDAAVREADNPDPDPPAESPAESPAAGGSPAPAAEAPTADASAPERPDPPQAPTGTEGTSRRGTSSRATSSPGTSSRATSGQGVGGRRAAAGAGAARGRGRRAGRVRRRGRDPGP